jgi:putative addiction module component (TIGR02574 family)
MNAKELIRHAIALPRSGQIALLEALQDQLYSGFASEEIEQAWLEEIKRRVEAIRSGRTKTIPAEEVFANMDARIKAAKN